MMNFDQCVGDLVGSITSFKGRTDHSGIIHSQIIDPGSVRFQAGGSAAVGHRPACRSRLGKNDGMRKQYNFRPSANGLDAWDVDNLIAASADLPVREVVLDSIADVDTDFWFKFGPTPTVRRIIDQVRLIQEADLSYPIILGSDGRVMDGMHRIARAILDGRSTIKAVRFIAEPEPDYLDCSPEDLPY